MLSLKSLSLLFALTLSATAQVVITAHDYEANGPDAFTACGQQLRVFDISRITAWDQITGGADPQNCGTCLEICGAEGCGDFLAVDLKGSAGVDVAIPGFKQITGLEPDRVEGSVTVVDASRCEGIQTGEAKVKSRVKRAIKALA